MRACCERTCQVGPECTGRCRQLTCQHSWSKRSGPCIMQPTAPSSCVCEFRKSAPRREAPGPQAAGCSTPPSHGADGRTPRSRPSSSSTFTLHCSSSPATLVSCISSCPIMMLCRGAWAGQEYKFGAAKCNVGYSPSQGQQPSPSGQNLGKLLMFPTPSMARPRTAMKCGSASRMPAVRCLGRAPGPRSTPPSSAPVLAALLRPLLHIMRSRQVPCSSSGSPVLAAWKGNSRTSAAEQPSSDNSSSEASSHDGIVMLAS